MRNRLLFLAITCLLSISCAAQNGFLILEQDQRIDTLLLKQRQIHANDSTIDGFRVQIFMELGNDALHHADSLREVFINDYPDVPIYLIFGQPYYRLRVGDYRTRLEAENMYQRLRKKYRNSFVTADRIELPYIALCSQIIEFDTVEQQDTLKNRFFIEEETFEIDTLLLDSLMYLDSINNINNSIFYDE